jgi:hypothetical protein
MAEYVVGDVLEEDIYIVDTYGNPLVTLTPTTHDGVGPAGAFGFHVSEVGGGHYRVYSNPTSIDGFYGVRVQANDPFNQQFNLSFDVGVGAAEVSLLTPGSRTTLGELRRMLARRQQDYLRIVASEASDPARVVDSMNLVHTTDHFRGGEIVCVSGNRVNVGQRRKVVSSRYETYHIDLLMPFPAPIIAGDTFDLYNVNQSGNTIAAYDQHINDAIRLAWPANREKLVVDVGTYDRHVDGLPIPTDLTHLYDVHVYVDDIFQWTQVPPTNHRGGRGWFVNRGNRTVGVGHGLEYVLDEKAIRLYGYGRPKELVLDTDSTATDIEWVLEMASGAMLINELDQATFPIGQSKINRADQLRAKMVVPSEPNTVSID